jgi:branched-chain amino acid transport system substrate-binding protein
MRKTLVFLVLLGVWVGLCCIHPLSFAADTIKVGIVDTYSGPATSFTSDVLDGFKLAVEKINAKGGVLGKKI